MEAITVRDLLTAVGGTLIGPETSLDRTVSSVDTDSRDIHPGSLFLPLVGSASTATPISAPPWRREPPDASPPGSRSTIRRDASTSR